MEKKQRGLRWDLGGLLTELGGFQRELGGPLTELGGPQKDLGGAQTVVGGPYREPRGLWEAGALGGWDGRRYSQLPKSNIAHVVLGGQ